MDSAKRSIFKTITWRITGSGATFFVAWLISGNLAAAGSIAVIQLITNTILYYGHERIWNNVRWGRS